MAAPKQASGEIDVDPRNEARDVREPRCEILEVATRDVWQGFDPCSRAWYEALALGPGFLKVGWGAGTMDRSWFRRSPGADVDGPVRTRELAGRAFFACARAPEDVEPGPPRRMMIDKHHSLLFAGGRAVDVLTTAAGARYVQVVTGAADASAPDLPDGWRIDTLDLESDWVVELPHPCETLWFEGMVSFQGPLESLPGTGITG